MIHFKWNKVNFKWKIRKKTQCFSCCLAVLTIYSQVWFHFFYRSMIFSKLAHIPNIESPPLLQSKRTNPTGKKSFWYVLLFVLLCYLLCVHFSFFSGKKREILDDVILMAWELGEEATNIIFFSSFHPLSQLLVLIFLSLSLCLRMILFESRAFVCEKLHTYFIIIKNCSNNNVKRCFTV